MADKDQKNRSANIVKEEEKSLKLLVEKNKTLSQTTGLEKDILNKKKEEKTLADKLVDQKNSTIDSLISSAENMSTSIFGGSVGGIINVLMTGKVKTMLKNNRADIEAAKEREKETKLQNDLLVKNRLEKSKIAAEERAYQIEAIKATEARNKKGDTTGIITDGQVRRMNQKNDNLLALKVREIMTKNPIKVDKEMLAIKALSIMNEKKITTLCVNDSFKKKKTIGIIHIHNILENNIS